MSNIYSANSDTVFETLADHIFKNHGKEIGNAAENKNFAIAVLKKKGKRIEAGGLDFTETVLTSENSNIGWRSAYATIDANYQSPTKSLSFEPKVMSGTIVINDLHKAMNRGEYAIKPFLKTLTTQAETTIGNIWNTSLWTASPGALEPESIRSICPDDPTTGSIGGQSRVTNTWARSITYTTAISDAGSEAGITALHNVRFQLGGGAQVVPDIAITTREIFAGIWGYLDSLRRLRADEDMVKLGFDAIYFGTALLSWDAGAPASHFYYVNSNHTFLKVLSELDYKFEPFSKKDNSMNSTSIFKHACNLTTNLPAANGVATNVSVS